MIMAYDQSRLGIANLQINCLRLEKNPVTICGYFSSTCIGHTKQKSPPICKKAADWLPFSLPHFLAGGGGGAGGAPGGGGGMPASWARTGAE